MNYKILLIIIIIYSFFGCDNVDVLDSNVEFKQKIVIQGELYADEYFSGVRMTKTQPLNNNSDSIKFIISDAYPYLIINDVQIVPLHHSMDGTYKSLYEFKIKEGTNYEFFCEYDETNIYSKTYVPFKPEIINSTFINNQYAQAIVTTKPKEVYGASWVVTDKNQTYATSEDFYSISNSFKNKYLNNILVRTTIIPEEYLRQEFTEKIHLQVYAFDESFLGYYKTRNDNDPIRDIFSQGSGSIVWNVTGENVIGLFIGISRSKIIKIN